MTETFIEIERLQIYAYHGVMEQETKVGNKFEVSIKIAYPFEKAMETDDLSETASYATICDIIKREMAIPSKLIEHVAGRIKNAILAEFPKVSGLSLKIKKVNPPINCQNSGASVLINWKA